MVCIVETNIKACWLRLPTEAMHTVVDVWGRSATQYFIYWYLCPPGSLLILPDHLLLLLLNPGNTKQTEEE